MVIVFCHAGGNLFCLGQIPIKDTILCRYVPDEWHGRILSIKFSLNLCVGAGVLPISNLIMQRGCEFNTLFILVNGDASDIFLAAVILPN